jgi:hypothetical protein
MAALGQILADTGGGVAGAQYRRHPDQGGESES